MSLDLIGWESFNRVVVLIFLHGTDLAATCGWQEIRWQSLVLKLSFQHQFRIFTWVRKCGLHFRWLTGQRTWLRKWLKLTQLCTTSTYKIIKGVRFQVTFRKYALHFPSQNLKYMYNSIRYTLKNRLRKNEKMRTKEKIDQ